MNLLVLLLVESAASWHVSCLYGPHRLQDRKALKKLSMSISPTAASSLEFEAATTESLPEVASFFVEAFWLASTTFGDGIELSSGERNQLIRTVSADLGARYGLLRSKRPETLRGNTRDSSSLFSSKLIVARDGSGGAVVGCAGIEGSLFDTASGAVLRSDQASRLLRTEIDNLDSSESEEAASTYAESGIGALAERVLQESCSLAQPWACSYVPYALLANLAVAPAFRRTGLGRELCAVCELGCEEWGLRSMLLQVEQGNGAARRLYERLGYSQIYSAEATSVRLSPAKPTLFSALLPLENDSLLREEPSTLVTMAKSV